ncbi:DMT family transporter [Allosphingosinicella flava]|uniref:DMT family transporter n=1 Tax=Allosphingosinicella flava TaxID=2771430 RepID=A0A7T2GJ00_9SPHN|nr:DMT family transporter [Sphingosinicella flava]QPQ54740.1 DMT family transporter [Sphingosinicella flava]
MSENRTAAAFGVATLGIACFSAMDAVMKDLSLSIGTYNALLWRTLAGAVIGGIVFFGRRMPWPGPIAMRLHLRRGVVGALTAIFFFWGLARVPLAQAIALAFIAPLIALYLASVLLGEKITRSAILASAFGFAGVIVILAGQARADLGEEAVLGAVSILIAACFYAYNIILMRQQAQAAGPVEIAFFISTIMTFCFLLAAPFLAVPPPVAELPAIGGAAVLAFVSLLLLAWAYARTQAQYLAPVEYTGFVWAALFGYLFFGEKVAPLTLAGAAMIVAACLVAARQKPVSMAEMEAGL